MREKDWKYEKSVAKCGHGKINDRETSVELYTITHKVAAFCSRRRDCRQRLLFCYTIYIYIICAIIETASDFTSRTVHFFSHQPK